jgi:threonine/homoserine/homoserine lactone efflux protein
MTQLETALAILLLLVTPGPTNTLLALAGAERGWLRALRLIPSELLGYLSVTLPLALVGARLLEAAPTARTLVTAAAGAWVLWLALSMWRLPDAQSAGLTVTARRVMVTTMLNPKGLVFGLVLLPATEVAKLLGNFALFVTLIVAVAASWALLGSVLHKPATASSGLPGAWRRAASLWLGALGVYLLGRVAGLA